MKFQTILNQGQGILRMVPNWVPRSFCIPGRRLKLHPNDLYAFGAHRGGIDERWFASTVKASNGPKTLPDEGLSYVASSSGPNAEKILFSDMVSDLGANLIGSELWENYHRWPIFAKFFDNQGALPHHLHQRKEHAEMVGLQPKPEAYFFPIQMNNHLGNFPHTFFGLEAGTQKEDIRRCLKNWDIGDNGILNLSKAYRLQVGTGWMIPAGILHAPGSLCTFEPQWASDISAMFQSLVNDVPAGWNSLVGSLPEDKKHDLDFIISLIDWDANTSNDFKESHFLVPLPVKPEQEMESEGYLEKWITYGGEYFSAQELTILPGRTITLKDQGAYSVIAVQGHGSMGAWQVETPTLIRFGQLTNDEFFVSAQAAQEGVRFYNPSDSEPLVLMKTFGPGIWK